MLQRIWLYLQEMYPPLPSFGIATISFFNLYFVLQILYGQPLRVTWPAIGGALTLFLFLLFLRISDELKDLESDKVLFPERLVPSGKVLVSDLKGLMAFSIVGMWLLNLLVTGVPLAFAVLFAYGVLMFFYFFLRPLISGSLLLALISHNPSVLLMNYYVMSLFCQQYNKPLLTPEHGFLAVLFWLPGLAWELGRKIRAPQDENEYETYSRIFGYRVAALLPSFALCIHYFMLIKLALPLQLSWWFLGALSLALLTVLGFFGRFLNAPDSRSARLKPVVEGYMLVSALGLLIELVWRRGVSGW